jgi:hypothetical protein
LNWSDRSVDCVQFVCHDHFYACCAAWIDSVKPDWVRLVQAV